MVPKNASLTSIAGQLLEEFAGTFGNLPNASDLFPADLFDAFCAQNCALPHNHKTPEQYAEHYGSGSVI